MNNYRSTLTKSVKSYNQMIKLCPDARLTERNKLIELLNVKTGDLIVDAPAGGGFLAQGIKNRGGTPICVEPASEFAALGLTDFLVHVAPLSRLPISNRVADSYGSLAGLHYLPPNELNSFFAEASRVLKPGGVLAVADIQADTSIAEFLNGPVDRLSETGSQGAFFQLGDLSDCMERAAVTPDFEKYVPLVWTFPSEAVMVEFVTLLFGLVKGSPDVIYNEIVSHLDTWSGDKCVCLGWGLIYTAGRS